MRESGPLRKLFGLSGWIAAIAAVSWLAVVSCEQEESDAETGKLLDAVVARSSNIVAKAERRSEASGKSKQTQRDVALSYEWNPTSLYGLLGNVSGETAALARRIKSAFQADDFDELMACVDDALKCRNPIVRAMMASSLTHYAQYSSLPDNVAFVGLKAGSIVLNSGWKKAGEEDLQRLQAVIPAASLFLDDENATVGRFAAKAWIAGLRRMDAGTVRLEATRDFFNKGNEAVLDEFGRMNKLDVTAYCELENESKAEWAQMLADAIESPINSDYETIARYMYKELMQEEYADQANTAKSLEWMENVEQFASERYSDPKDVADLMNFATGSGQDQFDERAREVYEEINSEFTTAFAAIKAANSISTAEKEIAERYGDGEEAKAMLAKKIEEVISEQKKLDELLVFERKKGESK